MRLLFFVVVVVLREAAVAIAMKIVSYVIATLVRYPLQKCSSVSTLTFVSHISKLLLWHEVDLRTVRPTSKAYRLMYSNISITQLKCQHVTACFKTEKHLVFSPSAASKIYVLKLKLYWRFTVVYLTLTGLQKTKSWSQLNTSGVTLYADLEPKTHHQTPMTCTYTI